MHAISQDRSAAGADFQSWQKAELHCHLDGAVRPATADELADRMRLDLPRPLHLIAPADCASQAEYLTYFTDAIAVMQTESALERVACELGEDAAADGITYLEVRWAPRLHLTRGLSVQRVIDAVLNGLRASPVCASAIVCAMRNHPVDENVALARAAGEFAGRGVVGFDLAGDEARWPAAPQARAFEAARAAGLRLTCHAGEAGEPANVEEALALGIERVAHGVIGAREPRIVERLRREGVTLDLCPTANWKCRAVPRPEDHPLPRLVRAGVRCTLSTDSPTIAGTTLSQEFRVAHQVLGMTLDELERCNATAFDARFGA